MGPQGVTTQPKANPILELEHYYSPLNLKSLIDRTLNSAIPFLLLSSILIFSAMMTGLNGFSHHIQLPQQRVCQGFDQALHARIYRIWAETGGPPLEH